MRKIIILGPGYPLRGGIADFNEALCRTFRNKGIDCRIVSFSLQYPSFLFPGSSQYVPEGTKPPELEVYPKLNSINPVSWFHTARFINKVHPDLVISSYWLPFTGLSMAVVLKRLKSGIRRISLSHNIIPHQSMPFDAHITSFYVKQNEAFVVLSEAVANDLDRFDADMPRVVIPHPVYDIFGKPVSRDEAAEFLKLDKSYDYILFFGLVKPYKGLRYLVEAMRYLKDKLPNVRLIVAGEFYEEQKPYEDKIKSYGLEDRICLFPDFIPNEEVKYFFSMADVVVQPYLSATQSGITQVAYNFDKPMIVTDVGGLREIVEDGKTGYVVPKENPEAIARAVERFYADRKNIDFAAHVREIKKKFSWDGFAEKVLSLYEETKVR